MKRWRTIRDRYVRDNRIDPPTGPFAKKGIPAWKDLPQLAFLKPTLGFRK